MHKKEATMDVGYRNKSLHSQVTNISHEVSQYLIIILIFII